MMSDQTIEGTVQEAPLFQEVQRDYYREFQQKESIPVYSGFHIG